MKKALSIILLATLILGVFVGCKKTAEKDNEINLVFVTPLLTHPVWLQAKEGFEIACKDYGIKGEWVGPTGIDVDAMIKQIDLAIASKADGIITMAINAEAMMPAFERVAEAKIPLILMNSDSPESTRLAYLGMEETNFGRTIAETALKNLKGKKPVVAAMTSDLTQPSARKMFEAAKKTLAAAGDYEWVITVEDKSDSMIAVQKVEEILNTYPEVNVFFNTVAEGAYCEAKVVREKGLEGKVTIIGVSVLDETADYIREGVVYATMSENYFRMGYQPVQWLVDYIKNGISPAKVVNDAGTIAVTKENLDTYEAELTNRDLWK